MTLTTKLVTADCLFNKGKIKKAYAILSAPGIADDASKLLQSSVLYLYAGEYGRCAFLLKKYDHSEPMYSLARSTWQKSGIDSKYEISILSGLAECYEAEGKVDQASEAYRDAMKLADGMNSNLSNDSAICALTQNYSNFLFEHSSLFSHQQDFFKAIQLYERSKSLRHSS